jgi:hypothetical protein
MQNLMFANFFCMQGDEEITSEIPNDADSGRDVMIDIGRAVVALILCFRLVLYSR